MANVGRHLGFLVILTLVVLAGGEVRAASYVAPVKYRQTMTKVADEANPLFQGWGNDYSRHFHEIVASPENAMVGFTVKLDNYLDKHLYVMKRDGSQVVDLTPYLVQAGVDPNNVYALRMDNNGLRMFFFGVYGTDIYYVDTTNLHQCLPAFKGLAGGDGRVKYTVNYAGDRLFFKHVTSAQGYNYPGLYYANVGDPTFTAHPVLLMNQLPGPQNTNVLRYLGSSRNGGSLVCTYFGSAAGNSLAMWRGQEGQAPIKVPNEEHTWIWGEQDIPLTIVTSQLGTPPAEGAASALYACQDSGQAETLYYLDLISGEKKRLLSETGGILYPTLFDNGYFTRVARFSGLGHKATRVNLLTGEKRDTHSYWFGESNGDGQILTDLTDNARWYLMGSKPVDQTGRIHLIDMASPATPGGWAPFVASIIFDKPALFFDDTTPLKVTVQVSDSKGLNNIAYVKMHALTDGREDPEWQNWSPLSYNADCSDGGGGSYTNDAITLRQDSTFFSRYPLPHEVGIRIVVKNKDDHYSITDTSILITTRGAASVCNYLLPLLLN